MTIYEVALIGYKQLERRAADASKHARDYARCGMIANAKRWQHVAAIRYRDVEQARHLLSLYPPPTRRSYAAGGFVDGPLRATRLVVGEDSGTHPTPSPLLNRH